MAWALRASKIEPNGECLVEHIFYGHTKKQADTRLQEHADICPKFGPADAAGEVITVFEEVDEIPTRDSIEAESEEGDEE